MGMLRSAVFFALYPAVGNAFVVIGPRFTPGQQASDGIGAPMEVVSSGQLDAGGALSKISGNDAGEAGKRPPRASFAEGHAGLCSPLYVFTGVQVRAYLQTHCCDQTKAPGPKNSMRATNGIVRRRDVECLIIVVAFLPRAQ